MRGFRPTLLVLCALTLVVPTADAAAQTGPETGGATVQDGPVTLITSPQGLVGRARLFSGTAGKANAGRQVVIERYDELSRQWSTLTSATVADDGAYSARWKADRPGSSRVRARVANSATAASSAPEVSFTLYRAQGATWYGPGFYGNETACGQKLTRTLLGVAHKTLPCGTQVEFLFRGRTLSVPVVDRGPYAEGFTWDLTSAAAQRLGFEGSGTIGALRLADARRRR